MSGVVSKETVSSELLDLVADIYQAAWEPEAWPLLMKQTARLLQADSGILFTPAEGLGERFLLVNQALPEDWMRLYAEHFWQHDIWTVRAAERGFLFQGALATGQELVGARDMKSCEFYHDFLVPCGVEQTLASVLFDDRATASIPRTHLSFLRAPGRKDFGEQEKRLLKLLMPHFQRALTIYWRNARDRLHQQAHESIFDRLGYAVVMLGQGGKVVYMNAAAEAMLKSCDGLWLQNERVSSRSVTGQAIQALITDALNGIGGNLMITRPSGKAPYNLVASPLTETNHFAHLAGMPAVALLIIDPECARQGNGVEVFAKAHQLTSAETRVLEGLLRDQSPKEIAQHFDLSIHTVRSQLSSVYAKTGVKTQRELVALVMRSSVAQL